MKKWEGKEATMVFLISHVELSDTLNLCAFITSENFDFESLM